MTVGTATSCVKAACLKKSGVLIKAGINNKCSQVGLCRAGLLLLPFCSYSSSAFSFAFSCFLSSVFLPLLSFFCFFFFGWLAAWPGLPRPGPHPTLSRLAVAGGLNHRAVEARWEPGAQQNPGKSREKRRKTRKTDEKREKTTKHVPGQWLGSCLDVGIPGDLETRPRAMAGGLFRGRAAGDPRKTSPSNGWGRVWLENATPAVPGAKHDACPKN